MAAAAVSSAAPLLALLEEDDDNLKVHALKQLDSVVAQFWYQISNYIPQVEALCEDQDFSYRESASLLVAKVYYYLRELDEALNYALGAGKLFKIDEDSEFVNTIVARALDKYFAQRQAGEKLSSSNGATGPAAAPEALEAIVDRMIERCTAHGRYEQAIGVCLEARRLDTLVAVARRAPAPVTALRYALSAARAVVARRPREAALSACVAALFDAADGAEGAGPVELAEACQVLMALGDAARVSDVLGALLRSGSPERRLLAMQLAFDLYENDHPAFMAAVSEKLRAAQAALPPPLGAEAAAASAAGAPAEEAAAVRRTLDIASGAWPVHLHLEFLYYHNAADLLVLKNIKGAIDTRASMCHSALVMANAFMHAGTTVDTFLRQNLDWLAAATNWAKFGATASLGVVHRGHVDNTLELLAPHLPGQGRTVSAYSEGGALYALGLIHAAAGAPVLPFLTSSLAASGHEVVQHGACLGLGLAALGSGDDAVFDRLKDVLYTDSAVAGEAAGLAMGLALAGSPDEAAGERRCEEMLAYAHDTGHGRIVRGLALGLAAACYGREERADALADALLAEQDPGLRYGGALALGSAYRGTASNAAIERLLRVAVTDASDDVRRGAVIALGFTLLGAPQHAPRLVAQLAGSHSAHLRYGAAMAVGIACSGTGLKAAEAMLKPMLADSVDFVRQGACIATALVMLQAPEERLGEFRRHLAAAATDKHEAAVAKMGAILAAGILDAGGRNVTVGAAAGAPGAFRRTPVLALLVFTQYWFWFPFAYTLALAFKPTALLAVGADLRLPKLTVTCRVKKGTFAYAKPVSDLAKKKVSKLPTAVLSTTKKAAERAKRKAEARSDAGVAAPMETDEGRGSGGEGVGADSEGGAKEAGKDAAAAAERAAKEDAEKCPYNLENASRVVPAQAMHIEWDAEARYAPVMPRRAAGVVVLHDRRPGEPVELLEQQTGAGPAGAAGAAVAAAAGADAPAVGGDGAAANGAQGEAPAAEPDAPEDMALEE